MNDVRPIALRGRDGGAELEVGPDGAPSNALRAGDGGSSRSQLVAIHENQPTEETVVRRLSPIECERLQGFPDNWTEGQSDSARYRQLGNSVAIPVDREPHRELGGVMTENEWAAVIPEPPDDLTAVVDKRGNVWHRAEPVWKFGAAVLTWPNLVLDCGPVRRKPAPPIEIPANRLDLDRMHRVYSEAFDYAVDTNTAHRGRRPRLPARR